MASNQVFSLGRITVAVPGTPIQVTVNESVPDAHIGAHSLLIERDDPNDTGLIYIGRSANMVRATLFDVVAILPVPTVGALPSISITLTPGHNALDMRDFWIDADVGTDSVLGSYLVG